MDVGNPSNFARILDLYENSHEAICKEISGVSYTDDQIRETLSEVYKKYNYLLDPHGTCGYRALTEKLEWRNRYFPGNSTPCQILGNSGRSYQHPC